MAKKITLRLTDDEMKEIAYLAFALLGMIWGINFIFMKWAAKEVSPSQIVLLRVAFGFLPIFIFAWVTRFILLVTQP